MVVELSVVDLTISGGLLLLAGAISVALRLGLERRLAVAATRTVVQLLLVGLVLGWVFALEQWPVVLAVVASMVVNAGIAAIRRTERRYDGIWATGLIAVTLSSVVTTFVVVEVVIRVEPWFAPRYVLPLLGMILGNTLTGLSLALDRLMRDLDEKRDEVESALAVGATIWEACRPMVREAMRTGLVPIINAMSVAGVVSLPGMMTGQILAGVDPVEAVKYQIVVMFMLAASTSLGALAAVLMAFRQLVTPRHQLAAHRLVRLTAKR